MIYFYDIYLNSKKIDVLIVLLIYMLYIYYISTC